MATINVLSPRDFLYLQAVSAWLPCLDTQPIDEYEDDDEELTDKERRELEELEDEEAAFNRFLWNRGPHKNHGFLHLRWGEDIQLEMHLDQRAVNRLLRFLSDEQARRQRDIEYDV